MVCHRCIMAVQTELQKLDLHPVLITLGEVELKEDNIDAIKGQLSQQLQSIGFELIDDKKSRIIEKIKTII